MNRQIVLAVDSEPLRRGLEKVFLRLPALAGTNRVVSNSGMGCEAVACIGWSAVSELATKPEFAWLIASDIPYQRLPVTLSVLHSFLQQATSSAVGRQPQTHLSIPLGQLTWALNSASEAIRGGDAGSERRLRELQRFARIHWPGTFDVALHAVAQELSLGNAERTTEALKRIGLTATAAALHHSLRWLDGDEVGAALLEGITLLQQASVMPDALDEADLAELVGKDWWSPAQECLNTVIVEIRDLTDAGISLPSELLGYMRWLSDAVAGLEVICLKLAKTANEQADDMQEIIDWKTAGSLCQEVSDVVAWLRADAERVSRELENIQPSRG